MQSQPKPCVFESDLAPLLSAFVAEKKRMGFKYGSIAPCCTAVFLTSAVVTAGRPVYTDSHAVSQQEEQNALGRALCPH